MNRVGIWFQGVLNLFNKKKTLFCIPSKYYHCSLFMTVTWVSTTCGDVGCQPSTILTIYPTNKFWHLYMLTFFINSSIPGRNPHSLHQWGLAPDNGFQMLATLIQNSWKFGVSATDRTSMRQAWPNMVEKKTNFYKPVFWWTKWPWYADVQW